MNLSDYLEKEEARRENDKRRFKEADDDLCVMCHAYGADKRSLFIACFYAVHEVVPEAIDIHGLDLEQHKNGYYLRICKTCRGKFLRKLWEWREEAIMWRHTPKDHDGTPEESQGDLSNLIPVRLHGATVYMTPDGYEEYKRKRDKPTE